MGEYEPDDSRNVTQKKGPEPGGLERTGPREDEARAKAQRENKKRPDSGKRMPEPQQRQAQSQSQSQSQSQGGSRRDMNATQPEGSPLAGNQPQAKDNAAGAAEPTYDQYELNQPSNLAKHGVRHPGGSHPGGTVEDPAPQRATAGERQDQPGEDPRQGSQAAQQGGAQAAYGNSRTQQGESEKDEIDAVKRDDDLKGAEDPDIARADANRELYEGPDK